MIFHIAHAIVAEILLVMYSLPLILQEYCYVLRLHCVTYTTVIFQACQVTRVMLMPSHSINASSYTGEFILINCNEKSHCLQPLHEVMLKIIFMSRAKRMRLVLKENLPDNLTVRPQKLQVCHACFYGIMLFTKEKSSLCL